MRSESYSGPEPWGDYIVLTERGRLTWRSLIRFVINGLMFFASIIVLLMIYHALELIL